MMRALLDINVLLALFDADHVDHTRTREWLEDRDRPRLGLLRDHPERVRTGHQPAPLSEPDSGRAGYRAAVACDAERASRVLALRAEPARWTNRRSHPSPRSTPGHRCLPVCSCPCPRRTLCHLRPRYPPGGCRRRTTRQPRSALKVPLVGGWRERTKGQPPRAWMPNLTNDLLANREGLGQK